MSSPTFSSGSPLYIRYKDHVLFKNTQQPIEDAVERETIGWLSKQTDEIMLIEHDRTLPDPRITNGRGSGVIILRSCIIEIRELPLQKSQELVLNSPNTQSKGEFALQPKKRKTHRAKSSKGDNNT